MLFALDDDADERQLRENGSPNRSRMRVSGGNDREPHLAAGDPTEPTIGQVVTDLLAEPTFGQDAVNSTPPIACERRLQDRSRADLASSRSNRRSARR